MYILMCESVGGTSIPHGAIQTGLVQVGGTIHGATATIDLSTASGAGNSQYKNVLCIWSGNGTWIVSELTIAA